ncbi:MAG: ABC transporter permease [candidate division Zixibacteria bacterium]|nr:ABC transporter permease [candidate division Zixibacteria bacterium]
MSEALEHSDAPSRLGPWLAAARLGWAIESNWADPFVFMTYQIVRPLFGALILVVMFKIVTGQPTSSAVFGQMYVGNAFFILVVQCVSCIGLVIFDDRERYQMLRYIYLAPIGLGAYLAARGMARLAATTVSILFTLAVGAWLFGLRYHLSPADLPYFSLILILGGIATLAMGIMLGGSTMLMAQNGWSMPEGVSGVLYLFCGAVFSIDILPWPFSAVARLIPWTYWLEGIRRSLLGSGYVASLAGLTNAQILLRLGIGTAGTVAVAWLTLRFAEYRAVATGKLDEKTDH